MRIYETSRRHPGSGGPVAGLGAARARARRRGDARARGGRLRARDRPLRRRRVPLDRGARSSSGRSLLGVLLFSRSRAAAARAVRPARCGALRLERPLRAVYEGDPRLPRPRPRCSSACSLLTLAVQALRMLPIWRGGEGGRRRPVAAAVLRDGAAALPRPARAVHDQRARRARVVLRLASSAGSASSPRRRSRPGSCSSSSTSRSRCPGALILGWESIRGRRWLDVAVVVLTYNALPWVERALDSCAGTRRSSSTTARPTARSSSCASGSPTCASSSRRTSASAAATTAASRETTGAVRAAPQRRRVVRSTTRLERLARVRRGASARGGRRAAAAQPGRLAAALGARLPDAVAARDRVPLPAQARAALARAERRSTRRLRPRDRARGGLPIRRLPARPARGGRRGRRARRGLLPVQRGDRLVLPLPRAPAGRCCSSPGAEVVHVGGARARRAAVPRERPRAPALPREAPRARATAERGAAAAALRAARARRCVFRGERGARYRDAARWLGARRRAARCSSDDRLRCGSLLRRRRVVARCPAGRSPRALGLRGASATLVWALASSAARSR